jgi:Ca2+-transporting ATPase
VVLLELLIDPACSLVFEAEPEADDCMTRPPRPAHVGLVSPAAVLRALWVGLVALAGLVLVVALARSADLDDAWLRLVALGALIVGNVLILQRYRHRSRVRNREHTNRAFSWLLVAVAAACAVILLAAPLLPQLGLPGHDALRVVALVLGGFGAVLVHRLRRGGVSRISMTPPAESSRRASI